MVFCLADKVGVRSTRAWAISGLWEFFIFLVYTFFQGVPSGWGAELNVPSVTVGDVDNESDIEDMQVLDLDDEKEPDFVAV